MYSKLPHQGRSNEYTQHTTCIIILQKIEKLSLNYTHLPPNLALWLTLSGRNYPCTEQIFYGPKDVLSHWFWLYKVSDLNVVTHMFPYGTAIS